MENRPKLQIFALGGTIAMVPSASPGVHPSLTAEDMLSAAPELSSIAEISAQTLLNKGSANLTFDEIVTVCRSCEQSGADGFVITQGTDTMEETSFLASLIYKNTKPIVFTGAMRSPTQAGADGKANLLAAALTAVAEKTPHVAVVMNDEVHHPFYVTKAHTSNVAAFQSVVRGPIGQIAEGNVFLHPFTHHPTFDVPDEFAPIALLTALLDDDGRMFDHVLDAGYRGLVVEGFGAGHVSESIADKLAEIAKHIPVILSSRVRAGVVFEKTYGYRGAEMDLLSRGLVPAGRLSGRKARILLSLLVGLYNHEWKECFTDVIKHV